MLLRCWEEAERSRKVWVRGGACEGMSEGMGEGMDEGMDEGMATQARMSSRYEVWVRVWMRVWSGYTSSDDPISKIPPHTIHPNPSYLTPPHPTYTHRHAFVVFRAAGGG